LVQSLSSEANNSVANQEMLRI